MEKDRFKTEQEAFWKGDFGDSYIDRNRITPKNLAATIYFFSRVLSKISNITSVIELGANIGINLMAINKLLPATKLAAVEINETAVNELKKYEYIKKIYHSSILQLQTTEDYDLVFTKGVLIHINPENLAEVYKLLYNTSRKYILIAEYYNPTPVEIIYHGNRNKLFKRDFAGEIMDMFPELDLLDYGFIYHRDYNFPQDDITYFLLSK